MLQAAKRAGAAFAGAQLPTQSGPARSYLPDERPGWVDVQTELLLTGTAGPEAVAGQQRGDQLPGDTCTRQLPNAQVPCDGGRRRWSRDGVRAGHPLSNQLSRHLMMWRPCIGRSRRSGRLSTGPIRSRLVSFFPSAGPLAASLSRPVCTHGTWSPRGAPGPGCLDEGYEAQPGWPAACSWLTRPSTRPYRAGLAHPVAWPPMPARRPWAPLPRWGRPSAANPSTLQPARGVGREGVRDAPIPLEWRPTLPRGDRLPRPPTTHGSAFAAPSRRRCRPTDGSRRSPPSPTCSSSSSSANCDNPVPTPRAEVGSLPAAASRRKSREGCHLPAHLHRRGAPTVLA